PLEELVIDGVSSLEDDVYTFASATIRAQTASLMPPASRPSLCRVAAAAAEAGGDVVRAGRLFIDAGDAPRAAALLEEWTSADADEAVRVIRRIPRGAL